jgi:quercetin dioxygenase-like cupin family protein
MGHNKIHIRPDDYLEDMDEIRDGSEPRSRMLYYIEPYGPHGLNEVCEANFYVGNRVFYHEHSSGYETFLVYGGSFEVISLSKVAVARKGDIIHFAPYTPHSIHTLEDDSKWRAYHQGLWFSDRKSEELALRDRHWDAIFTPEFSKENNAREGHVRFDYQLPHCREVPASELYGLRPYDYALAEYEFDGISLGLKVGRWETQGAKEVWQLRLKAGYTLSWDIVHPFTHLYDVFSGSVRVTLEGMEPLVAQSRDLLHIPRLLSGKVEALEDTVLLDMGCQGFLTRLMDELNLHKAKDAAKLKDTAFIQGLMKKHDYHVLFERL